MPPYDFGAVAVVDGRTIKITPLRTANVPPPMSMFEVEAARTAIDVAFSGDNSSMAVLHHGGVDLYSWQTKNGRSILPRLVAKYSFDDAGNVERPLQISFAPSGHLFVLYFRTGLKACKIVPVDGAESVTIKDSVTFIEEVSFVQANSTAATSEHQNGLCVQTQAGRLLCLRGHGEPAEALPAGFPSHLPWVEVSEIQGETIAFGMSRSGHLYANSRLLVKNCTSFLVTGDHLVFTTSNHLLKFAHLTGIEGMPPFAPTAHLFSQVPLESFKY